MCGDVRLYDHHRDLHNDFEVWKLGVTATNSFILRQHSADVTIVLSDNDVQLGTMQDLEPCCPYSNATTTHRLWKERGCLPADAVACWHHDRVVAFLDALGFVPDVVLIATINFETIETRAERIRYVMLWPGCCGSFAPCQLMHLKIAIY